MVRVWVSVWVLGQLVAAPSWAKPALDRSVTQWVALDTETAPRISGDGRYVAYCQGKQNAFGVDCNTQVLQSTDGGWRRELPGIETGLFTPDSNAFVYLDKGMLQLVKLGATTVESIADVESYEVVPSGLAQKQSRWIAWQLKGAKRELVVHDYRSGTERRMSSVVGHTFDATGSGALITTARPSGERALMWLDLVSGRSETVWTGSGGQELVGYGVDPRGKQLSFVVREQHDGGDANTLWYYRKGMAQAVEEIGERPIGLGAGFSLMAGIPMFTSDGEHILFLIHKPEPKKVSPDAVSVDVWGYKEPVMHSEQAHQRDPQYWASIGVEDSHIIRLNRDENERVEVFGNYSTVTHDESGDRYWLKDLEWTDLVSLRDGSRRRLQQLDGLELSNQSAQFSPGGRYLIYTKGKQYYAYDVQSDQEHNLSAAIQGEALVCTLGGPCTQDGESTDPGEQNPIGIAGWRSADAGLVIYAEYDLWQLDPSGKRPPINLTHGYGLRHRIKLRLAEPPPSNHVLDGDALLLVALHTETKENGFYRMATRPDQDPQPLTMGRWTMDHVNLARGNELADHGLIPVKAEGAKIWLVSRSSDTEAPNLYVTKDLKHFRALTDMHPQRDYNWLTAEVVKYRQPNGIEVQGVLYKPEDFNSGLKYPVIINYYTEKSDFAFEFHFAALTATAEPNIPWFVSHRYLVFTPDTQNLREQHGEGARQAVEGAADYLAALAYVDASRLALSGHSHGGTLSNYLVTHTHRFAAVVSGSAGSGGVDIIGSALDPPEHGGGDMERMEKETIGASLWARPDLWIAQSPLFQADRVTTPFLILQCKADVNWDRTYEFFTALRRLGKKTWLLQYDRGNHSLYNEPEQEDFTLRLEQFFDHYLKSAPAPKWMTEGVPARLKGVETGLELDTSGKEP